MSKQGESLYNAVDQHIRELLQEYDNKRIAPLVARIEELEKEQQPNEDA